MKVKDLKEVLSKMPDDAEVITYIDEDEAYGDISGVCLITNKENMPYAKGSVPEVEVEKTVLISGWVIS